MLFFPHPCTWAVVFLTSYIFASKFSLLSVLQLLARYSPLLLIGIEEELLNFIKDDNDTIKEGALHILAKAGGIIREQLATSSRYSCKIPLFFLLDLLKYILVSN